MENVIDKPDEIIKDADKASRVVLENYWRSRDELIQPMRPKWREWQDLYRSITQTLFSFSDDTALHPGHGPATTIGEEKQHNPFFCGKS